MAAAETYGLVTIVGNYNRLSIAIDSYNISVQMGMNVVEARVVTAHEYCVCVCVCVCMYLGICSIGMLDS
jgi:hypothetical protein